MVSISYSQEFLEMACMIFLTLEGSSGINSIMLTILSILAGWNGNKFDQFRISYHFFWKVALRIMKFYLHEGSTLFFSVISNLSLIKIQVARS